MRASRGNLLLLAFALLAITIGVYWPGLSGGFIFDDHPNIVTNSRVHAEKLTLGSIRQAASGYEAGSYGRPLATITFAIDYSIGGKDPWIYKATSLLVHLINSLLVFWLAHRILTLPRVGMASPAWPAFAIALFWSIHPLQISSVLYVVQRMETMCATFILLGLLAYIRGRTNQRDGARGWPWLAGAALLAALGMLCKESAILFPVYCLALEATLLRFEAKVPKTKRFLVIAYLLGFAAISIAFAVFVLPQYMAPHAFDGRDFTLGERLLTQMRILPMYIGQMLLPLPSTLAFYYDAYAKSTGWLSPATTLAGGAFLIGLLVAALLLRKRAPLASLGIFWFFAAHLLTSNVFNLELVFEHRNYFALLGVTLVVADLARRIPMRDGPALKYAAIAAVVIGFGFLATLRSATWGNELQLASDLVAKNPNSARASSDLATYYVGMSDSNPRSPFFAMGAAEFERGSRLPNSSPLPEQGLILMAATTGQPVKDEWWDRLISKVRSRPTSPQEMMAVTGLMTQRYRGIELDDVHLTEAFSALLERHPNALLHVQFGDYALKYLHDEDLADQQFLAAVELAGESDPEYPAKIAGALVSDGRIRQAKLVLQRIAELNLAPDPRR